MVEAATGGAGGGAAGAVGAIAFLTGGATAGGAETRSGGVTQTPELSAVSFCPKGRYGEDCPVALAPSPSVQIVTRIQPACSIAPRMETSPGQSVCRKQPKVRGLPNSSEIS